MNNKRVFKYLIIFIMVIACSYIRVNAKELAGMCELSNEYKAWLKLSNEEKSKSIMPPMCKQTYVRENYYLLPQLYNLKDQIYPSKYDSRNVAGKNYVTPVKNQQQVGSCWAFAALANIETYLLKNNFGEYEFSSRHMDYKSSRYFLNNQLNLDGYNRRAGKGGNKFMAANYLLNGYGPIAESEMPFLNNEDLIDINSLNNKKVLFDINGYEFVSNPAVRPTTDILNKIKKIVMEQGSATSTVYMTTNPRFYNYSTSSLNFNVNNYGVYANHAITIIGWDDNYSKNNFSKDSLPEKNGAWIIKNSYGKDWEAGKEGYFYISYEDLFINRNIGTVRSLDNHVEDYNYHHDKLGPTSFYGYNNPKAVAANIYELKTPQEILKEISFLTKANTKYNIFVNPNSDNLNEVKLVGSGKSTYEGYHTFKLPKEILLENKKFVIMIEYEIESGTHPIGVQTYIPDLFDLKNETPNISLVAPSRNGIWEDLSDKKEHPFAIIKASTDKLEYNFQINEPKSVPKRPHNSENYQIDIPLSLTNINPKNLKINITNNKVNVNDKFNIKYDNNKYLITNKNNLAVKGKYDVEISYYDIHKSTSFNIYEQYDLVNLPIINKTNMYHINENIIELPVEASGYEDNYELKLNIYNSNNEEIKNIKIVNNKLINNQAKIELTIPKETLPGKYKIIITGNNKILEKSFEIIEYIPVESISIIPKHPTLVVEEVAEFKVEIKPDNATIKDIIWEIKDNNIASINQDGIVKAKSRGLTYLTIKSKDNETITDSTSVQVLDPRLSVTDAFIKGENPLDKEELFIGSKGNIKIQVDTQDIINKVEAKIYDVHEHTVNGFDISITNNKNQYEVNINYDGKLPSGIYYVIITGDSLVSDMYAFQIYEPAKITALQFKDIKTSSGMMIDLTSKIVPDNAYNVDLSYNISNMKVVNIVNNILFALNPGETTITATTTDGSNISKTFKVTVVDPIFIRTNYYHDGRYLMGVNEKTSYNTFMSLLELEQDDIVTIYNESKTSKITSGYIGTGMILEKKYKFNDKYITVNYQIIVNGDVSGDGEIASNDVLLLRRYVVKLQALKECYTRAADVDKDKDVSSRDALKIRRYIVKLGSL